MPTFKDDEINEIAQQLDCGFRAFYHKVTLELIFVPDMLKYPEMDQMAWKQELKKLHKNANQYVEIEGPESHDSFKIMADFTDTFAYDNALKSKLTVALGSKHPFRHFKFIIDNSGAYRQKWFDYKSSRLIAWVKNQLC